MMKKEDISKQIWDYVDGNCSSEEELTIRQSIANNPAWTKEYDLISGLHQQLDGLPLEQVSFGFSENIMAQLPSVKSSDAQTEGLLSFPGKLLSIGAFVVILLVSLAEYWPSVHATSSTAIYKSLEAGLHNFMNIFNVQLQLNGYVLITIGLFFVLLADHFIAEASLRFR